MRLKSKPGSKEMKPNKNPHLHPESTREFVKEHLRWKREKYCAIENGFSAGWRIHLSFAVTNLQEDWSDKAWMKIQNRLRIRLNTGCTLASWMSPRRWKYVWKNGHYAGSNWLTKQIIVKPETQKAMGHAEYVSAKGWVSQWSWRFGRNKYSQE